MLNRHLSYHLKGLQYHHVDLIKNMRSILDVVNSRVHWKSNELLPMGILIKQLDDIIATIQ